MGTSPEADRLFAELVARGEKITDEEIRALGAENPSLVDDLLALYEDWKRLDPFFRRLGADDAVSDAIGAAVAPTVPDGATPIDDSGPAYVDEIVSRLLGRKGAFSRYRVEEEVARGGMGAIHRVFDEDLRRNLAMKVILDLDKPGDGGRERSPPNERRLARFLEEAQVAGQLDHPGIVPVHELGLDDQGRLYFTMKMVKGRSLREVYELVSAEEDGWNLTRAIGLLQKVCEAMAYAHDKRVLHRDLKPANVMIGRFGEVFVMDWGLSRVLGRDDSKDIRIRPRHDPLPSVVDTERLEQKAGRPDSPLYTMDGDVVGTPAFMSPEQANGQLDRIGPASDIYGVGAMLYQLLARRMPYVSPDTPVNNYAILSRVQDGPPRPIHEVAADTPVELQSICEKAMTREIADRYASMSEMADDLRAYVENRVVTAHRTGVTAELSKWIVRNQALAVCVASIIVLVIGGAALASWSEADKHSRLQAAFAKTDAERKEKTRLSDVMTARFLETDVEKHTPDHAGIQRMEQWVAQLADIETRAGGYRTAAAADETAELVRAELSETLERLVRLRGLRPRVTRALADAASLRERTVVAYADDWRAAIGAIKGSPHYGGIEIRPQVGLVPLGENEQGLWDFWVILSGERPPTDGPGTAESGVVLALIPGGSFVMGTMPEEPGHEHNEFAHTRFVEPFLMSKYELTQAQYERVNGDNPSQYPPGTERLQVVTTTSHPVENISWYRARSTCERLDLRLPHEHEWEYAAKAGETAAFHWGDEPASLEGHENVADASTAQLASKAGRSILGMATWDDGYPLHAPVGAHDPNRFGLYDIFGNVGEWTESRHHRDYGQADAPVPSSASDLRVRIARGGNHGAGPFFSRAAQRQPQNPEFVSFIIGIRPARSLEP